MDLSSPLEAHAFLYATTLAFSVWIWLAVAFAALGLWRIRTVSYSSKPEPPRATGTTESEPSSESNEKAWAAGSHLVEDTDCGGTPKGRFTAYFLMDDNDGDDHKGDDNGAGGDDIDIIDASWMETTKRRRKGDLGLYRYQDLAAFNGSVVRLWQRDSELHRQI